MSFIIEVNGSHSSVCVFLSIIVVNSQGQQLSCTGIRSVCVQAPILVYFSVSLLMCVWVLVNVYHMHVYYVVACEYWRTDSLH